MSKSSTDEGYQSKEKHGQSITSLPGSSHGTRPYPSICGDRRDCPSHSRAAGNAQAEGVQLMEAQPGSGNMIYSSLFSLLFHTSLLYTYDFGKVALDK